MSMLDVVYNVCNIAMRDPILRSRPLRLVETVCKSAWEQRWLLLDEKEIDRLYPMARRGIRSSLRSVLFEALSYVPHFRPMHSDLCLG